MGTKRTFVVRRRWMTTEDVVGIELAPADSLPLPPFDPGAHVEFFIDRPGQPPLVRQYSLCNGPGETDAFVFGIKREPQSRGGSHWIHGLSQGDQVSLGAVRNLFPISPEAGSHLLLAGGIGITPVLAMAQKLASVGAEYQVHYFVRGTDHVAFRDRLKGSEAAGRLQIHAGLDAAKVKAVLGEVLARPRQDAHAYCCGPGVFMDTVAEVAAAEWPSERVHFERFQAPAAQIATSADVAFDVVQHKSGRRCHVEGGQSIVQALAAAGCDVMTSCEQGVCGTCLTNVLEGTPDHRDAYLSKVEREGGRLILPCVSRSKTATLVLDL